MGRLYQLMMTKCNESQVAILSRFFKTGKGQYGEGDKFLGIKVPVTRSVVKQYVKGEVLVDDIEECITSEYHEMRMAGLQVLVWIYRKIKKNEERQKWCVDYYLSHLEWINNWDLVDLSCYDILGNWLLTRDRNLLYDLARNGKTIWEQRIGIVSTMAFARAGQTDDIYRIAEIFLSKDDKLHDLLQKAVGWLLREAGKRNEQQLKAWLLPRCSTMPRTMLRYAIEKFKEEERKRFLVPSTSSG